MESIVVFFGVILTVANPGVVISVLCLIKNFKIFIKLSWQSIPKAGTGNDGM